MSLEILFNYEKELNNVKCKADAVVCSIHACFISKGYKCIGKGEEFPTQDIRPSDMMPAGWNDNKDCYALIYQLKSEKFLLKVLNVDQLLLVHLLRDADKTIVDLELTPADFITDNLSTFESAYRNPDRLRSLIESELIARQSRISFKSPRKGEPENRRRPTPTQRDPYSGIPDRATDPFLIGRNDLDPFAAGSGSGMVYDPLHSGFDPLRSPVPSGPFLPNHGGGFTDPTRIPRGSVPYGARFDPIGPSFDPTRNMEPDPDEMRPPDYDNMFM